MRYTTVVKNEKSKNKRDILKNILCNVLYNILCTTITILNMIFYELFFERSKYEVSVKSVPSVIVETIRRNVKNILYENIYINVYI